MFRELTDAIRKSPQSVVADILGCAAILAIVVSGLHLSALV